jgi:chitosanase
MVVHGPGNDAQSFGGIRAAAMKTAKTPAQGGNETTYLNAFMDARVKAMKAEAAHEDVTRIENAQRVFLKAGNLNLDLPLSWSVYGDKYSIAK